MGMAVRFTKAKGDTPPIPEETTMTGVIGKTALATLAAKCMGNSITAGSTDIFAAIVRIKAATAKKGALPEPITYHYKNHADCTKPGQLRQCDNSTNSSFYHKSFDA